MEVRSLRDGARRGLGMTPPQPSACRGIAFLEADKLDRFTRLAVEALSAGWAVVWLADGPRLTRASRAGSSRSTRRRHLPIDHPLWLATASAGAALLVPDVRARPELARAPFLRSAGACAAAPLLDGRGEAIGVLCACAREPRQWTSRDAPILEALATGAAAEVSRQRDLAECSVAMGEAARLQESVARTLASMPLEVGLLDGRGRYLYLTSSIGGEDGFATSLIGGTDEDYCRLRALEPAIGEARRTALRAAVREKKLVELEESIRDSGGHRRYFSRLIAPVPEADGEVRWVLAVGVEITKRKKFEAALQASEARYRHLVEHASDMICQTDTTGRFTYVNPVAARLTGYPVSELLGMHYSQLIRPDYRERMAEFYRQQELERAPSSYYEFPGVTADGRELWMGQSLQPLIESGMKVGAEAVARDITERHRAEEALRVSEARTKAILETSLDAVVSVAADGRVLEFNPAAEVMFGYTAAELLGGPAPRLLLSPQSRAAKGAVAGFPEPSRGERVEATGLRADGDTFPVEISVTATADDEGVPAFTAFVRDITVRKRAEEALIAATDAARAATRAKSALLATMTHEIRTPMNAILGATELLLEGRLDADSVELGTIVQTNARALLVLLNAFLDSAKIEAGQLKLEDAPFDPRDVLDDVVETLAAAAGAKGLELVVSAEPIMPARLLGDALRIRQVLLNLGDNAIKFTAQGEIAIRADLTGVAAPEDPPPELHFSVSDTGIGISAADQARIFEPFAQVSPNGERARGTGLGLGISRSLVRLMGGRMEVESVPQRGSTFHVYLPLRLARWAGTPDSARPSLADVRALVIALPGSLRNMIGGVLRRAGAAVVEASSVLEALALASGGEPVTTGELVLIADDAIPDFAGIEELTRRIARQTGRRPRIIALRAPDSAERGLPEVKGIWLRRPLRPRGLLRAIERARAQRHTTTPALATRSAAALCARPGARVLLVDDSHEARVTTGRLLRASLFAVDVAGSGERAVSMANASRYDAILMDLDLPGMDGFAAAEAIRAAEREHGRPRVPILALTGLEGEGVRDRALGSGMDAFLSKPVAPERLVEAITRSLEPRAAILVAEDAPDGRALTEWALLDADYRVVAVADGRQAVEAFAREAFSLVLLDLQMPVMDGFATARAIRLMRHGALVPIVALTGHEQAEVRARCLEVGFSSFLSKPVRPADLRSAVEQTLAAARRVARSGERPGGGRHELAKRMPARGRPLLARLVRMREGLGRWEPEVVARAASEAVRMAARLGLVDLARVCAEAAAAAQRGEAPLTAFWIERASDELLEAARVLVVREIEVAPAAGAAAFGQLARLAASTLATPIVVLSLLDAHRQLVIGDVGLPRAGEALSAESPLSRHVVRARHAFVEEDAGGDPLVRDHPALSEVGIAAYLGVPLITGDGFAVGTLSAMDTLPRQWSPGDLWFLRVLANFAVSELEARRSRPTVPPARPGRVAAVAPAAGSEPSLLPEPQAGKSVQVEPHIAELVPTFLDNRRNDARRVAELLEHGQLEEIGRIGHNLKSCSAGYGFAEMSAIGRELERAAEEGDRDRVRALVCRLQEHVTTVTWSVAEPEPASPRGAARAGRWRHGSPARAR